MINMRKKSHETVPLNSFNSIHHFWTQNHIFSLTPTTILATFSKYEVGFTKKFQKFSRT